MIMKTKAIILILIVSIGVLMSCRVKENCELNNTGTIVVTNNLPNEIEVYIDNNKVFTLQPNETKKAEKPVGTYSVNCFYQANEWNFTAQVIQCEEAIIAVPE